MGGSGGGGIGIGSGVGVGVPGVGPIGVNSGLGVSFYSYDSFKNISLDRSPRYRRIRKQWNRRSGTGKWWLVRNILRSRSFYPYRTNRNLIRTWNREMIFQTHILNYLQIFIFKNVLFKKLRERLCTRLLINVNIDFGSKKIKIRIESVESLFFSGLENLVHLWQSDYC